MENYNFNILIVDDERSNLEVLCHILKSGHILNTKKNEKQTDPLVMNYTISVAKSGREALIKVQNNKPDLILLDIVMPDMSGFDVLTTLKSSDATRSIPVIIITGLSSVTDEEKGFLLGAVDYITKPFHSSLVKARVKIQLQIVQQIRTIEQLGLLDVLTNIPNRRSFETHITGEWGQAICEKTPISMLMIDVDTFKEYNDRYGHQQGDLALQVVAKVLCSVLRHPTELAARWGGEEFAVILPDTEQDDAFILADTIRAYIESTQIPSFCNNPPSHVTVSIGIATTRPRTKSLIADFISKVDKALYTAKKTGRNKVCF